MKPNQITQINPDRYVSSKEVISKVYRDLNLKDDVNDRWQDFIEWIGEAMEYLHIEATLCRKVVEVSIEGNRGRLPCDFYLEGQIRNCLISTPQSQATWDFTDTFPHSGQFSQYIEYPYINTSFTEGTITMEYLAFPIDSENFPLIPDNQYVREALFWYIFMKLILGGFTHPNPIFNYLFVQDKWREYCKKAKTDYRMVNSINEMEALKTGWVKLIPVFFEYHSGFATLATPENLSL